MVYDSKNSKMVLFGGTDNTSYRNDTWEWDGTEWIQVADAGPPNRHAHSMVYNSSDKEMLLFGGLDSTTGSTVVFSDTWKMKNNVWTKIRDMGPGPLYAADMIYTGNRAVLFGGSDGIAISHNTWDWRGNLWTQRQNMGPPGRGLRSMAYDNDRKLVVLFGGIDESRNFNDTWELTIKDST
jgi:hypothetical protein